MAPVITDSSSATFDSDDGPSLDQLESQMGGEVAARDIIPSRPVVSRRAMPAAGSDDGEDDDERGAAGGESIKGAPLPPLDGLIARLPAEIRETLDELFRARFVSVKKLPKKVFCAASAKGSAPGIS